MAKRAPKKKFDAAEAEGKHLVIVESPTKAKTINKYLGKDYFVMASVGHVRDLPKSAPKGTKRKDHPVPGVDLANRFRPTYEVMPDKKSTVTDLKKAAKKKKKKTSVKVGVGYENGKFKGKVGIAIKF